MVKGLQSLPGFHVALTVGEVHAMLGVVCIDAVCLQQVLEESW